MKFRRGARNVSQYFTICTWAKRLIASPVGLPLQLLLPQAACSLSPSFFCIFHYLLERLPWQRLKDALMSFKSIVVVVFFFLRLVVFRSENKMRI